MEASLSEDLSSESPVLAPAQFSMALLSSEASEEDQFSILLWSRLFLTAPALLSDLQKRMADNKRLERGVGVLASWITWFPEDFREEAVMQRVKKIFQHLKQHENEVKVKLNSVHLLQTLTSHLSAIRKHEMSLPSPTEKVSSTEVLNKLQASVRNCYFPPHISKVETVWSRLRQRETR